MNTEDVDKRIGMPDVDAEWARFEREVIGKEAEAKPKKWKVYALAGGFAIAASLLLLFLLHTGKGQTENAPLIARQTDTHQGNQQVADTGKDTCETEVILPAENAVTSQTAPFEQAIANNHPTENTVANADNTDTRIFACVEESASFPGGDRECQRFIVENLSYPELAKEYRAQGRVITTFLVDSIGQLSDVKTVRFIIKCDTALTSHMSEPELLQLKEQINQQLGQEAIRVINIMPRWIPCKMNGKDVRQRCALPIRFSLEAIE